MKTLDHNAIGRSLSVMGFRLEEQTRAKRHEADAYQPSEVTQQFQIPVSGKIGTANPVKGIAGVLITLAAQHSDVTIHFPETIYYAPTQRRNKNEDPQFWWGAQLDKGDVLFSVHVRNWLLDVNANYIGAVVRVNVTLPPNLNLGVEKGSEYAGTIHATFQGLSIPIEDPGFDATP